MLRALRFFQNVPQLPIEVFRYFASSGTQKGSLS